ncbi:MAG TPA: MarR family transcriptional regulator [Myxococcota bacterium]|nr:MarR family transcriptional regulator [Myxococcota bacterium]HRY92483.1 MarR family transcriptional regulator [Myxococcota bacterium]HSA23320.1 MarR family transcriptional regulator [Myxococcota bacterium]
MRALWAVVHGLQLASKRMAADIGLTGPQRLVVRIIGRARGITPGELASILHLDPSTLTGILQRLERARLIRRSRDPKDRRRVHLSLTRQGLALDELRRGTVEASVRAALSQMTPRELAITLRSLERLASALLGPQATPPGG